MIINNNIYTNPRLSSMERKNKKLSHNIFNLMNDNDDERSNSIVSNNNNNNTNNSMTLNGNQTNENGNPNTTLDIGNDHNISNVDLPMMNEIHNNIDNIFDDVNDNISFDNSYSNLEDVAILNNDDCFYDEDDRILLKNRELLASTDGVVTQYESQNKELPSIDEKYWMNVEAGKQVDYQSLILLNSPLYLLDILHPFYYRVLYLPYKEKTFDYLAQLYLIETNITNNGKNYYFDQKHKNSPKYQRDLIMKAAFCRSLPKVLATLINNCLSNDSNFRTIYYILYALYIRHNIEFYQRKRSNFRANVWNDVIVPPLLHPNFKLNKINNNHSWLEEKQKQMQFRTKKPQMFVEVVTLDANSEQNIDRLKNCYDKYDNLPVQQNVPVTEESEKNIDFMSIFDDNQNEKTNQNVTNEEDGKVGPSSDLSKTQTPETKTDITESNNSETDQQDNNGDVEKQDKEKEQEKAKESENEKQKKEEDKDKNKSKSGRPKIKSGKREIDDDSSSCNSSVGVMSGDEDGEKKDNNCNDSNDNVNDENSEHNDGNVNSTEDNKTDSDNNSQDSDLDMIIPKPQLSDDSESDDFESSSENDTILKRRRTSRRGKKDKAKDKSSKQKTDNDNKNESGDAKEKNKELDIFAMQVASTASELRAPLPAKHKKVDKLDVAALRKEQDLDTQPTMTGIESLKFDITENMPIMAKKNESGEELQHDNGWPAYETMVNSYDPGIFDFEEPLTRRQRAQLLGRPDYKRPKQRLRVNTQQHQYDVHDPKGSVSDIKDENSNSNKNNNNNGSQQEDIRISPTLELDVPTGELEKYKKLVVGSDSSGDGDGDDDDDGDLEESDVNVSDSEMVGDVDDMVVQASVIYMAPQYDVECPGIDRCCGRLIRWCHGCENCINNLNISVCPQEDCPIVNENICHKHEHCSHQTTMETIGLAVIDERMSEKQIRWTLKRQENEMPWEIGDYLQVYVKDLCNNKSKWIDARIRNISNNFIFVEFIPWHYMYSKWMLQDSKYIRPAFELEDKYNSKMMATRDIFNDVSDSDNSSDGESSSSSEEINGFSSKKFLKDLWNEIKEDDKKKNEENNANDENKNDDDVDLIDEFMNSVKNIDQNIDIDVNDCNLENNDIQDVEIDDIDQEKNDPNYDYNCDKENNNPENISEEESDVDIDLANGESTNVRYRLRRSTLKQRKNLRSELTTEQNDNENENNIDDNASDASVTWNEDELNASMKETSNDNLNVDDNDNNNQSKEIEMPLQHDNNAYQIQKRKQDKKQKKEKKKNVRLSEKKDNARLIRIGCRIIIKKPRLAYGRVIWNWRQNDLFCIQLDDEPVEQAKTYHVNESKWQLQVLTRVACDLSKVPHHPPLQLVMAEYGNEEIAMLSNYKPSLNNGSFGAVLYSKYCVYYENPSHHYAPSLSTGCFGSYVVKSMKVKRRSVEFDHGLGLHCVFRYLRCKPICELT